MKLKDIKTDVDLAIFSDEKDKEIKLLNEELKRAENTCKLLDKENISLINCELRLSKWRKTPNSYFCEDKLTE